MFMDWKSSQTKSNYEDSNSNRPRVVFAKFLSWKICQDVRGWFIDNNRKNAQDPTVPKVYVEQMQSKQLSMRTNNALKYRKQLKAENPNWQMFVSHPAKLNCKKPGEDKYQVIKEFWDIPQNYCWF